MPDVFLSSGAMVTVSDEDYEFAKVGAWRIWTVDTKVRAVWDVRAEGRLYRLHLHREIAFRMKPEFIGRADRLRVIAKNGDFLDVRRENLEIVLHPRKPGRPKRPNGYAAPQLNGSGSGVPEPPAWSRAARGRSAVRRDGQGGAIDDRDPGASGRSKLDQADL